VGQELSNRSADRTNIWTKYQENPLGLNPFGPGAPPIVGFSYRNGERSHGIEYVVSGLHEESHAGYTQGPQNSGEQLSPCLRDLMRPYVQKVIVQGKKYSPVDDARFKQGIPGWVNAVVAITPGAVYPKAITFGLSDINYDPQFLKLEKGTTEDLRTIIEEVFHTGQFLHVWSRMDAGTSYEDAKTFWGKVYLTAAAQGMGYKNDLEKRAQDAAADILQSMKFDNDPAITGRDLCGFNVSGKIRRPNW
jgi:hypothetical protein